MHYGETAAYEIQAYAETVIACTVCFQPQTLLEVHDSLPQQFQSGVWRKEVNYMWILLHAEVELKHSTQGLSCAGDLIIWKESLNLAVLRKKIRGQYSAFNFDGGTNDFMH